MTDASTITLPALLTEEQAAEFLNFKPQTLALWRCTHRVSLPWVRVGRNVRYRREDVLAFISENTVTAG